MSVLINLRSGSEATAPWVNILPDNGSPVELPGGDWTFQYLSLPGGGANALGTSTEPTGEAEWVAIPTQAGRASRSGHAADTADNWVQIQIISDVPITIDCFGNGPAGRVTDIRVNGGTAVAYDIGNNSTEIVSFDVPAGTNLLEYSRSASSGGASYLNAIRLTEAPSTDPAITITNEGDITPGTTLTVVASNYSAAPTTASVTDSEANEIMPTPTVTADGDDYNVSVSIADYLEAAKSTPTSGLLPGPCTLEVS